MNNQNKLQKIKKGFLLEQKNETDLEIAKTSFKRIR